ncbi:MAG: phosphoribosyltransferase [Pseudomonadota bacterium]
MPNLMILSCLLSKECDAYLKGKQISDGNERLSVERVLNVQKNQPELSIHGAYNQLTNELLENKKNVILQTSLTAKSTLATALKAKNQGYEIVVAHIGLNAHRLYLERGVNKTLTEVKDQIESSRQNLEVLARIADRVEYLDHSTGDFQAVRVIEKGMTTFLRLPEEQNVVGQSKIDRGILGSREWGLAKGSKDEVAASAIIQQLWSNKKTDRLKEQFRGQKLVFIAQPSSSGQNVIPKVLAEKLASHFHDTPIDTEKLVFPMHGMASKNIPRTSRVFQQREYEFLNLPEFKRLVMGKTAIIVDDVLTTGGSVSQFVRKLDSEGIEVKSVVALMGDRRLNVDLVTRQRLAEVLESRGIDINAEKLANRLTRTEAGGLIMRLNGLKSEKAVSVMSRDLRDLITKNSGRGHSMTSGIKDEFHSGDLEPSVKEATTSYVSDTYHFKRELEIER